MSKITRTMMATGIALISLMTSGCFLQTISGATFQSGASLITTVQTDSILATCVNGGFGTQNVECTYFFFDENGVPVETSSSADLISEFGLLGVVIDPLILQVPDDAADVTATYDDGAGTSGALTIQSGFRSIPVDTYRTLTAEPGHVFIIAELPDGVPFEDAQYQFSLSFAQPGASDPVAVKPLLAIRYDVGKQVFHIPFLPCVTDMADVAAVPIPAATTLQPIAVGTAPVGCDGEQFLLAGFAVFPCDFDGDDDVDIDDLTVQASVRNSPALPGDRMDSDSDGTIDIYDVRRCALQCTRPQCSTALTRRDHKHLRGLVQ